ncbi:MAG: transglutaminase domain-containing protein, partial [Bacteroidia bacterium]|nr:transglutaminase domain-containing protein [Bacteroidia bacterium]
MVKERYTTDDIVREILARFRASHGEVRALAARIGRERPLRDTAHLIFRLLKHIQYRRDPEGIQDVKAPAVTWADGYGDCKSYAVFAGSLLYHLGIPFRFRFTTWEPGEVKHVYVVATSEDGTEVVIDPTLRSFGIEDYYIQKRDYPIMPLRSIDGPSHALGLGCPPSLGCPADPRLAVAQQRARIAQASGRVYWDATNDQVTKVLTDALEVMNYPQCAVRAERLAHSVAEIAVPVGMRYGVPPPPGTLGLYALGRRPEIGIAPVALPLAAGAPLAAGTAAGAAAATPSFLAKAAGFIMPLLQKFGAPLVEFLKKIPLLGKVLGFIKGPEFDPPKYRGIAAISAYACAMSAQG